jgi:hypothetical protein
MDLSLFLYFLFGVSLLGIFLCSQLGLIVVDSTPFNWSTSQKYFPPLCGHALQQVRPKRTCDMILGLIMLSQFVPLWAPVSLFSLTSSLPKLLPLLAGDITQSLWPAILSPRFVSLCSTRMVFNPLVFSTLLKNHSANNVKRETRGKTLEEMAELFGDDLAFTEHIGAKFVRTEKDVANYNTNARKSNATKEHVEDVPR